MGYQKAFEVAQAAVAKGQVPCAAAAVFRFGEKPCLFAAGTLSASGALSGIAANVDTRFDLASLSKVVATATLLLRYRQQGRLTLDAPVSRWIPSFAADGKEGLTLLDLALHRSGLSALHDLTECANMQQAAQNIGELPLAYPPRQQTIYSDLGYITLGAVLERAGDKPLDVLVKEEVTTPLCMEHTSYRPEGGNIACTEYDESLGDCLCGVVHDENARAFGGVSGHAGLFSTAGDLSLFARMLLDGRDADGNLYLQDSYRRLLWENQTMELPGQGRAVGWMVNQPMAFEPNLRENPAGEGWSEDAFGHTGFTGTSLWVERQQGLACILLTNRVCPTRANASIFPLRRAFHTAAIRE